MTTKQPEFTLNRPGALIAALPAILGFVPEKSLILVSVDGGELGAVLRVDLCDELADTVGHLADVAAAAAPAAAIAVIVDAAGARCPVHHMRAEQRNVVARQLQRQGIDQPAMLVVADRAARAGGVDDHRDRRCRGGGRGDVG
ncbi:DUF4192 family protein, partial [Mycolicibacter sinensis]|uniref:DUF4192 family protein n=1 Tax=Mycolicibacter sinensis (strain JDM601) TaxID=875328 RepID=UPI001F206D84